MTTPTRSKPTPATETLLTAEELATCKRLAGGTDAAARRAQALLTLPVLLVSWRSARPMLWNEKISDG